MNNLTSKKPVRKITLLILALVLVSGIVYGTWRFFSKSEPTFPPEEPAEEPTTEPTTSEPTTQAELEEITPSPDIDTSDWKTYRNEGYGFEIKYPKDWILETSDSHVTMRPSQIKEEEWPPFILIDIRENPQKLSIREFYNKVGEIGGRDWFFQSDNEYTQGKVAGKLYYRFVPYITFAGEVAAVISIDSAFIEVVDFRAAFQGGIFDTMLSTLKFD